MEQTLNHKANKNIPTWTATIKTWAAFKNLRNGSKPWNKTCIYKTLGIYTKSSHPSYCNTSLNQLHVSYIFTISLPNTSYNQHELLAILYLIQQLTVGIHLCVYSLARNNQLIRSLIQGEHWTVERKLTRYDNELARYFGLIWCVCWQSSSPFWGSSCQSVYEPQA
jgi:hypothetical protein